MLKKYTITTQGFSLIELILYVALVSGMVLGFLSLSISVISARNKTYTTQEVRANMQFALEVISDRIRSASGVNTGTSTFATDPGVLSLSMSTPALNPTIIQLNANDGKIQITEGASGTTFLTTDRVKVTNLVFTNLTGTSDHENIGIDVTIEYNGQANDAVFSATQSISTAVSVRQ